MDFRISPQIEDLRLRIGAFVGEHILPLEGDRTAYDDHGNINDAQLKRLRGMARDEDLWCLQLSTDPSCTVSEWRTRTARSAMRR